MRVKLGVKGLLILVWGSLLSLGAANDSYVAGRLLVRHRGNPAASSINYTLRMHGAVVHRDLPQLGVSVLEVPEAASEAILESLRRSGLFEYVERDYYAHTAAIPNDPSFASQWHLPQIQAPQAWNLTIGSASVVVAVIDSGVDANHPDLASKIVPGWNFLTGTSNTSDVLGHGTAVAGTVAAASNNGIGVAGVSWSSQILPLAVVDANDFAAYSNIAAAILYATDHGARVINISIGGASPSVTLQNAVDYAWTKGAVVFASAMNNHTSTPSYPAACDHVVAVSATDANYQLASFSNYGNWITLSAPGTNILTTHLGGGYSYWYGTSFSSPIAAGVAALSLAVNPGLTNLALVALLEENSDDLGAAGFDASFGWGRINAYKAVLAAQQSSPVTISITPGAATLSPGQTLQFEATVTGLPDSTVTWSVIPPRGTISNGLYTAPASVAATQTVTVTATAVNGTVASATVTLAPTVTVSVAPQTVTMSAGQTQQFTATVNGSSAGATWALSPAVGAISIGGLYTAPASVSVPQTITVTATAANGVSASGIVSLVPPLVTLGLSPIRVNAGGPAYTDSLGQPWTADSGYTGGAIWSVANDVSNTASPALYQTCRYGVFSYILPVPNGNYTVNLKFAEVAMNGPGQRVFNVALNGTAVLSNFDIFAAAGGALIALDRSFPVAVTGGQIAIDFTNGPANSPMVNAIEILPGNSTGASSITPAGGPPSRQSPTGRYVRTKPGRQTRR